MFLDSSRKSTGTRAEALFTDVKLAPGRVAGALVQQSTRKHVSTTRNFNVRTNRKNLVWILKHNEDKATMIMRTGTKPVMPEIWTRLPCAAAIVPTTNKDKIVGRNARTTSAH